jgi:hypothetical protein
LKLDWLTHQRGIGRTEQHQTMRNRNRQMRAIRRKGTVDGWARQRIKAMEHLAIGNTPDLNRTIPDYEQQRGIGQKMYIERAAGGRLDRLQQLPIAGAPDLDTCAAQGCQELASG